MANKGWCFERSYAWLIIPVLLVLIPMFVVPLILIVIRSFSGPELSLDSYRQILSSSAYLTVLALTFRIALTVTLITLLLGYPFAWVISRTSGLIFKLLLAVVMVPFWTSAIVRTYAWMSLLPRRGPINQLLVSMGWVDEPLRLMNNIVGVHIGMVQILLPMMILPLLAVMRQIDMTKIRAAEIMGANPFQVFWYVYLPMSLAGIFSGSILVFISSLGFYITPALMGGTNDIMIAMLIEDQIRVTLNWPLASALGTLLLLTAGILFAVYERATFRRDAAN